jgi:hypothetical protein
MSKVIVSAGICGFSSVIKAKKVDGGGVELKITSPCDMVAKLGKELKAVDMAQVITRDMADSKVYRVSGKHISHPACPVPSAILKAIEVEMGLALPRDVHMKISR